MSLITDLCEKFCPIFQAANTKNAENYRLRCAVECDETDPYVGSNNYATSSATNVRFRMNGAAPVDVNEKIDKLFTMVSVLIKEIFSLLKSSLKTDGTSLGMTKCFQFAFQKIVN